MTCPSMKEVAAYLEGLLPSMEAHLAGCPHCRSAVELLRNLSALPATVGTEVGGCPPIGRWQAFVSGKGEAGGLSDHLASCDRCLHLVAAVQDLATPGVTEPARRPLHRRRFATPRRSWRWIAAAAAALLIAGGLWLLPGPKPAAPPSARGSVAPQPVPPPREREPDPRPAPPRAEDDRLRIEAEMREAVDRARNELRRTERTPNPVPVPAPVPAPDPIPKPQETVTAAAGVVEVRGEAYVLTVAGRREARAGDSIMAGQGMETAGAKGRATVAYPDGTRLELGANTVVRDLFDRGKRFLVARGAVRAEVAKQPAEQPLVIATPQGEARVLGTTLRLVVDADPKGATRLSVREGRVRLTRSADGKTVDVAAGQVAMAAVGVELAPRPERKIWANDFDGQAGVTQGEAVRLKERTGIVTAVASELITSPGAYSDRKISIRDEALPGGAPNALFAIPEGAEFRVRLKSDKPGKFEAQLIVDPAVQKLAFETLERISIGPEWKDVTLHPEDFFLWQDQGAMKPGEAIRVVNFYSFGAGRLYVDRVEVVSLAP